MALNICIQKNHYSDAKPHLIKRKFWGPPNSTGLMSLQVQFFCEEKPVDRTPTKHHKFTFKPYEKDVHKKQLCEDCVKAIKAYTKK